MARRHSGRAIGQLVVKSILLVLVLGAVLVVLPALLQP